MGRGGGKARTTGRAPHTAGAALGRAEQKGLAAGDPETRRGTGWGPLTGSLLRHALLRAAVTPAPPPQAFLTVPEYDSDAPASVAAVTPHSTQSQNPLWPGLRRGPAFQSPVTVACLRGGK